MNTSCSAIISGIADVGAARLVFEEKVSQKNKIVETNSTKIREMVRRIKASPNYTEAIGKLLGIVAEGSSFDPATAAPYVTLVKSATGFDFKFNLMNYFDAVAVFRRKPGETDFTQVAIDMKTPYGIASPVVNGTEYFFQYVKNDNLIGQPSDIITIKM